MAPSPPRRDSVTFLNAFAATIVAATTFVVALTGLTATVVTALNLVARL